MPASGKERMLKTLWDPRVARALITILIFALALAFVHAARETLTLFLFAILFAYLVDPLVSRLEKPLPGRAKAIAAVYILLLGIVVGAGFLVGPRIAEESKELTTSLPSLVERMSSGQLLSQVGNNHGWSGAKQAQIQNFLVSHRDDFLNYARLAGEKLATPAKHIWWLILIPILSVFFLKNGKSIAGNLVDLARDPAEKHVARGIVADVNVMLGSYIRAQLILSSLTLVVYTLVLSLMLVPYAFILGPVAGLFEFVPVVGPAVAALSVFVIAILSGYSHVVWLVVFLGVWRLTQDYVNGPRIMGKSLEISPLVQIFGVLAGGEIGGVVGALISVPTIAILRILWRRLSSPQSVEEPAVASMEA
jgi:predicted PurR-regulated permease PerM